MCNKTFYLKDGTPIKIGDTYRAVKHKKTEFGDITKVTEILVTENNIKNFLDKGILLCQAPGNENSQKTNEEKMLNILIGTAINRIAVKNKMTDSEVGSFLAILYAAHKGAAISLILKYIALILDEQYEGSIVKESTFYVIGLLDGLNIVQIHRNENAPRPNFQFFSAFRTYEDAEKAQKALKQMMARLDK